MADLLSIKGARVHNLKNVSLDIPKNKLVVVTGLSGSGKSSLAFDTIYAEGQRRYAESLSSYARQFMETRDKPDVDSLTGLSPTIAIDQKLFTQNPRSTVGTVTELYDYIRLLYARCGMQYCPECRVPVGQKTVGEIVEAVRRLARRQSEVTVVSPFVRQQAVDKKALMERIEQSGYEWVYIDQERLHLNQLSSFYFEPGERYTVDLVMGVLTNIKKQDPTQLVETAVDLSNGLVGVLTDGDRTVFSTIGLCPRCGRIVPPLDMRSFSFNSPYGACPRCTGLGITMEVDASLVIPNTRLTLAEGAIQPWTRLTGNYAATQKLLTAVAEGRGFSMQVPVVELRPEVTQLILYGTGEAQFEVDGRRMTFSGVIPDLMNKHLTTTSDYVRKEIEQYMREKVCSSCEGRRLRTESLAVFIGDHSIADVSRMSIDELTSVFMDRVKEIRSAVAQPVLKELAPRLANLQQVGLGYLTMDRAMNTISGGEATRVRLATQLSSGLTGVIYVLDEPSVGLHPRDNEKLIVTLKYLRSLGNTVIVVEHDPAMMHAADYIIDVGPGAGVYGGQIMAVGTLSQIQKSKRSLTGEYLAGKLTVMPERSKQKRKKESAKSAQLTIVGATEHNLKKITVDIPLGKLVCITGVSGSGKSTLVIDILGKALTKHFYRSKEEPGAHQAIKGIHNIDKVIAIDQSPIGRTPRSNPATYTGVFNGIRDLYASLPEARMRGYDAGKFSFNVKGGGRCEACSGDGYIRIPMQFLEDVYVECNECSGKRYNREALEVHYHNKHIADVLNMTVEEACSFFSDLPSIADKLTVLREVGLGYIRLGQPATTLSGGEAQRIKLAQELSRHATGKTLYILDEPTTGLHFEDIKRLLAVLYQLVDKGNSVVVIEHNLDLIRAGDWVIDLGPDGGNKGGEVVAVGTPADIRKNKKSWTGKFL